MTATWSAAAPASCWPQPPSPWSSSVSGRAALWMWRVVAAVTSNLFPQRSPDSAMQVPSVIFRQYDIRGVVGKEITPAVAHAIGRAIATVAHQRIGHAGRIAVGRDNRPSGETLAHAVR